MGDYLLCHAAFVLPAAFACYKTDGDLKKLKGNTAYLSRMIDANIEGYRAIRSAGHTILPKEDTDFESAAYRKTCLRFFKLICATSLGKICVSDHAMNAVDEMSALDRDLKRFFEEVGADDPVWQALEREAGEVSAMKITILATLLVFLAYFLLLYGAVSFIQDKRFFASAPQENLAAIPDRKERFRGAHVLGWVIEGLAVLLFLGAAALAVWDGVRNQFGFGAFFARFLFMLYAMEVYDIAFFDCVLLCRSNFFPHFYPELKGVVGPHMFGYNKRTHLIHFAIYLPASAAAAALCTLLPA